MHAQEALLANRAALGLAHASCAPDVYEFSTSGELGITATGAIVQDGMFMGMYALDYDLNSISFLLSKISNQEYSWAYAVERSGANAGVLVGSTEDTPLYDAERGARLTVKASSHSTIRESALLLEPNGWPQGFYQRFEGFGFGPTPMEEFTPFEVLNLECGGIPKPPKWQLPILQKPEISPEPTASRSGGHGRFHGRRWPARLAHRRRPGGRSLARGDTVVLKCH